MKLDRYQRLSLYNQLKILKSVENTDEYDIWIQILHEGFEYNYDDLFDWLHEPTSKDISEFVIEVLDMFRWIEHYKRDNPSDIEICGNYNSSFRGFDGNHEGKYCGYANFLIKDKGLWEESKNGIANSHSPMVDIYYKMLTVFKPNGIYAFEYPLTKIQVEQILAVH